MFQTEISFDSKFFDSLKVRWLKTKEIYILLQTVNELINNNDIELTNKPLALDTFSYYFCDYYYMNNWTKFENYIKESSFNLKVNGRDKVHCYSYSTNEYQKRIYHLIPNPQYCFIHYRPIEKKRDTPKQNPFTFPMFKIVDFSPSQISEAQNNETMLIIIESFLSLEELNKISQNIKIIFGHQIVNCKVIAQNVLSCIIPPQNENEVVVDIYMTSQDNLNEMRKVSYYDNTQKKTFKYVSLKQMQKTPSMIRSHTNSNSKINCSIFTYSDEEIKKKIISLIQSMLSHIDFYSNIINHHNSEFLDITFLIKNFNEDNLNFVLSKISNELNKINKLYIIDFVDNFGYNILHYISAINYSNSLQLLNRLKINLEYKSKDDLSCYEICAGRRNLESLTQLIEIADTGEMENENEEKFLNDVDILKSALNISLERNKIDQYDIKILDLLLKQIKIKYTVDATSGKIFNNLRNKENEKETKEKDEDDIINNNIKTIQRSVRGYLKRRKYRRMKKAANCLIKRFKNFTERKKFLNVKHATVFIQTQIRSWLNQKHDSIKKK